MSTFEERFQNLYEELCDALKNINCSVETNEALNSTIIISTNDLAVFLTVHDDYYEISSFKSSLCDFTSYLVNADKDGRYYYYLDSIEECIGELQRLFQSKIKNPVHSSKLREIMSADVFKKAYAQFLQQADQNAITKKSSGGKTPYGFSSKPMCDGADVSVHYGQGHASESPYMNWWVVSIYYTPRNGEIILGIECDRYPHLKEMVYKPQRYALVGNKGVSVAVFYSTTKDSVNYSELHERFIEICEEVMRLGLK